jgi:hypothetical protein
MVTTPTASPPPALQRIATTPVLASEKPDGFFAVKVNLLRPNPQIHTLGGVRIDFSNSHSSESESFALMRTSAAAVRLAPRKRGTLVPASSTRAPSRSTGLS